MFREVAAVDVPGFANKISGTSAPVVNVPMEGEYTLPASFSIHVLNQYWVFAWSWLYGILDLKFPVFICSCDPDMTGPTPLTTSALMFAPVTGLEVNTTPHASAFAGVFGSV